MPIKNQAIYGGFGLQAAGIYDRLDELPTDDEVFGVSAYLAGSTPIGSFTLGRRYAPDDCDRLALDRQADRHGVHPRRRPVPLAVGRAVEGVEANSFRVRSLAGSVVAHGIDHRGRSRGVDVVTGEVRNPRSTAS